MARFQLAALLIVALVLVPEDVVAVETTMEAQAGVMAIGTKYWRVRSITGTNGLEWAITHFSLYDSTDAGAAPLTLPLDTECTGHEDTKPTACLIKSSTKQVPKEDPDATNPDITAADLLPDTPHPLEDAFKDGDDTYWMSNTKNKDEFIGIQFENPVDVKKVKLKVLDIAHAPPRFVIEQSADGENWARALEVTDAKDWDQKIELFSWVPKDEVPSGVFAIRSQKDPTFCIGARPIPDPDEPDLVAPTPIDYSTELDVQRCSDERQTQFWYFDAANGRLHNAAGATYIARAGGGDSSGSEVPVDGSVAPSVGAEMTVGKCTTGCTDDTTNLFSYSDSAMGGFLRMSKSGWNNLVIAAPTDSDGNIAEGAVTIAQCGSNGNAPATLSSCTDLVNAQWELSPMFNIEPNKKAINCSPYSHSHAEPDICTDQLTAQTLCAKDKQCMAYNWVDNSAEGNDKDKVWLCHELHDVHFKTENDDLVGWELGLRNGFAEDLIEREKRKERLEEAREQLKAEMTKAK